MTRPARGAPALVALALILAITASWWALALWPLPDETPEWMARTRLVCFGATRTGLPSAGGWVLLVGQPLGMLILLLAVWGRDVRAGLRAMLERVPGQVTLGITSAALVAGLLGVVARVTDAGAEPFASTGAADAEALLTRLNDIPARLALVNQHGDTVSLGLYQGRAVVVTFAFAHCQTVCPLIVHSALAARDRIGETDPERTPVVLVVTLDPWRDTPSRLPAMAKQWGMSGDAFVLSGDPEHVERTLNAWRVPRVRNEQTGDLSHPSLVYVIGPGGRINYLVPGRAEQIIAAVKGL